MKPVRCPNHFPARKAPEATHVVATRRYCKPCRDFLLRPVVVTRVRKERR